MNLPDNLKRCCVCGRIVPKVPTKAEKELHHLQEELEDLSLLASAARTRIGRYKRENNAPRMREARDELSDVLNDIDRNTYYTGLLLTIVDANTKQGL